MKVVLSTNDEDICTAAMMLIEELKDMAGIHASQSADLCLEEKDLEGHTRWIKTLVAIEELLEAQRGMPK